MTINDKFDRIWRQNDSLLCVGLDSDTGKLPESIKTAVHPRFEFNRQIIEATHDLVCAYKPNTAFYEAGGADGIEDLKLTCDYIGEKYPEIPIIIDAKRADIGNTNNGYVSYVFDYLRGDAVTLHPFLGKEALKPFLDLKDKGCIILCRTSNSGAGEFQDLRLGSKADGSGPAGMSAKPLYQLLAGKVAEEWNYNQNCMLVVGSTYPEELGEVRKITGDMTILVPGIGAQGGDLEKTIRFGLNTRNTGLIISSSRGVIFASGGKDFAAAARNQAKELKNQINRLRYI